MNDDIDINEYLSENNKKCHNLTSPFLRTFKVNLKRFWQGNLLGFDIVGFDEWLGNRDNGQSCHDAILEKYGQEGMDIIDKLIA